MSSAATVSDAKTTADLQKTSLGFWIYLMTDCLIFGTLFAVFAVLRNSTAYSATADELFHFPFVLTETLILLTSSFTAGLAMIAMHYKQQAKLVGWLIVTFILGLAFLMLEIHEFSQLYHEGNTWQASAFLSSYFTLVGTHGLHILIGLVWLGTLIQFIISRGINSITIKRITLFSLFWHFLDIVWIFIFSFVYLMKGVLL